jgi:asparagine synthase (glutamine-hydrolysing)
MCGICGWLRISGIQLADIKQMNHRAAHRGPDGEGYWLWDGQSTTGQFVDVGSGEVENRDGILGMGHRRLAIIDLSTAGIQPMSSHDKKVWIVYNGEVYNYLELRTQLSNLGHKFHSSSDTEVVLAAYDHWGVDCFARFNGMWGMAIADLRRRVLVFSRDRLGIKPLYIWVKDGGLAFASELKQFFVLPGFKPIANLDAVVEYIDTGYEYPPATFFEGPLAFESGCWAEVPFAQIASPVFQRYWHPERLTLTQANHSEILEQTRNLFQDSVRLCLRSDVPVGVCLSGGLDSSAIFGQIQRIKKKDPAHPTFAFSAAFDDPRFDERPFIESVRREFGGQGFYTFPTAEAFLADCDDFIFLHDEPPGSLSMYAAWSVMRLARQWKVPVLLNGQGGDELFSGYWPAYYLFLRQTFTHAPWRAMNHLVGAVLPGGNPSLVGQLAPHLAQYQYRKKRNNRGMLCHSLHSRGFSRNSNWAIVAQHLTPEQYRLREIRQVHLPRLLKWDDRNSMAFSIEGRYPFLDYRLIEWALSLPPEINLKRGWNKFILRESLAHVLPTRIQWRRSKIGFETPQSEWIRTTLAATLREWLAHPSERLGGILDYSMMRQFADDLMNVNRLHRMDERQIVLVRLFFLDRWMNRFCVDVEY